MNFQWHVKWEKSLALAITINQVLIIIDLKMSLFLIFFSQNVSFNRLENGLMKNEKVIF